MHDHALVIEIVFNSEVKCTLGVNILISENVLNNYPANIEYYTVNNDIVALFVKFVARSFDNLFDAFWSIF